MITRLRLDAALYEPAPARPAGTIGRPRCKGKRLPTLQARLDDPATVWQAVTVERWYAIGTRTVHCCSDTAVWYHAGWPPVAIRWLLVKDPEERFTPQAFLSTDRTLTPQQMLSFFIQRWQVEPTFEEARAHLGMETQRQWNDQAIARTTPLVLALFTIVALLADTPLSRNRFVASNNRLGIAKPNPLFRMRWLGSENPSGSIFQCLRLNQTGKN